MAIKLALGPYEPRRPEAPSTIQARIYFLRAVEEKEPRVVSSLHGGAFIYFLCYIYLHFQSRIQAAKPLPKQTASEARQNLRNQITAEEIKKLIPSWKALTSIEEAHPVAASLQKWAENWQLNEAWCLDYAIRAMRMWLLSEYPDNPPSWWEADSGQFEEGGGLMNDAIWDNVSMVDVISLYEEAYGRGTSAYGFNFEYKEFSFHSEGWSPFYEEIGEWKDRVTRAFQSELDSFRSEHNSIPKGIKQAFARGTKEHVDSLRSAARKLGYEPAPKKLYFDHFRWLVYYQVRKPNQSFERIAKEHGAGIKTVSSGIKRTARLIGLKLRSPLPAGRKQRPA
jgi:hypothetical protein